MFTITTSVGFKELILHFACVFFRALKCERTHCLLDRRRVFCRLLEFVTVSMFPILVPFSIYAIRVTHSVASINPKPLGEGRVVFSASERQEKRALC